MRYIIYKIMKKLLIAFVTTMALLLPVGVPTVKASNVQQCMPGTGVNYIPCEPCYINSYGICVPYLGIEESEGRISTEVVVVSAAVFAVGLAFLANGSFLKEKIGK